MKKARQQVELIYEKYRSRQTPQDDPVFLVHRYQDEADQEVVAFISALLAFGQVKAIQTSLAKILDVLGKHPAAFLIAPISKSRKLFTDHGHRWVRAEDLDLLMSWIGSVLKKDGSLENYFFRHFRSEDGHIGPLLEKATQGIFSSLKEEKAQTFSRGFRYFFPSPVNGSPCKRLNLFLRWMVRERDGIDLGLWKKIAPSKLVIPMDVHIHRFAQRYRLSRYKAPCWEAALEVTEFLKTLDANDPLKYDYAICHYGMDVGW